MTIKYINGDATKPVCEGHKVICHICNDIGAWGSGFVIAVSKRWPQCKNLYEDWADYGIDFGLGETQFIQVEKNITIANMIAQHGTGFKHGVPLRYGSLLKCLDAVGAYALMYKASIHMPRIGCGLAGGKWENVLPLVKRTIGGLDVTVYDFDPVKSTSNHKRHAVPVCTTRG